MRIVCFGDSLALPREGCHYTDTWIAKLKTTFPSIDFICNFSGGMLVHDLFKYWNYMQFAGADIAIIQEGICDCAPRYIDEDNLFWKFIIKVAQKTRTIDVFWRIVKHGSRKPSCTCTPKKEFEKIIQEIISSMYMVGVRYVIVIKIGHGAPSIVKKSNFFNSNVDDYNSVFDHMKDKYNDKLIVIDPLNKVDEDMFIDGYHCNARGMDRVYNELVSVLSPIVTFE